MADGKKSFVLYADLLHTVEKLPAEKAGELFLHILRYVNDQNPETDDLIISVTFEPIKQQLKRDLKAWEQKQEQRRQAGLRSAEVRKGKTTDENDHQTEGNDRSTESNEKQQKKKGGTKKKSRGPKKPPDIEEVKKYFDENGYTEEAAKSFVGYYEAGDWTDSEGKPVINWKQKARMVWFKDQYKKSRQAGAMSEQQRRAIYGGSNPRV